MHRICYFRWGNHMGCISYGKGWEGSTFLTIKVKNLAGKWLWLPVGGVRCLAGRVSFWVISTIQFRWMKCPLLTLKPVRSPCVVYLRANLAGIHCVQEATHSRTSFNDQRDLQLVIQNVCLLLHIMFLLIESPQCSCCQTNNNFRANKLAHAKIYLLLWFSLVWLLKSRIICLDGSCPNMSKYAKI